MDLSKLSERLKSEIRSKIFEQLKVLNGEREHEVYVVTQTDFVCFADVQFDNTLPEFAVNLRAQFRMNFEPSNLEEKEADFVTRLAPVFGDDDWCDIENIGEYTRAFSTRLLPNAVEFFRTFDTLETAFGSVDFAQVKESGPIPIFGFVTKGMFALYYADSLFRLGRTEEALEAAQWGLVSNPRAINFKPKFRRLIERIEGRS